MCLLEMYPRLPKCWMPFKIGRRSKSATIEPPSLSQPCYINSTVVSLSPITHTHLVSFVSLFLYHISPTISKAYNISTLYNIYTQWALVVLPMSSLSRVVHLFLAAFLSITKVLGSTTIAA